MPRVHVNCSYGEHHVSHIREVLIPSLATSTRHPVTFNCINYDPASASRIVTDRRGSVTIRELRNTSPSNLGFAAAHNLLAGAAGDSPFFVMINPDCVAQPEAIDTLIRTFEKNAAATGIVEGRQWPFEHPKEYDPLTRTTPWASAAFALVNAVAYKALDGMDERYFLYTEDVDLSWRMWLAGYRVLYEPDAAVMHFSGGPFYREDLLENEKYYLVRNFVLLMRKFFGNAGEARAIELLKVWPDQETVRLALSDISLNFAGFAPASFPGIERQKQIKVLAVNQFHEFRA